MEPYCYFNANVEFHWRRQKYCTALRGILGRSAASFTFTELDDFYCRLMWQNKCSKRSDNALISMRLWNPILSGVTCGGGPFEQCYIKQLTFSNHNLHGTLSSTFFETCTKLIGLQIVGSPQLTGSSLFSPSFR